LERHYNELIKKIVKTEWNLPANRQMRSQMLFGKATNVAGDKDFKEIIERLKVFR